MFVGGWRVAEPDQLRWLAAELLIELAETSITGQRDDRGELSLNGEDVATMFSGEFAPHRREGFQRLELALDGPGARSSKGSQFLKGNRLQALDHFPPLGSKGSRESLTLPAAVAVAVTVCCASCWSRMVCRFSGRASLVRMKVCRAWKMLAITM